MFLVSRHQTKDKLEKISLHILVVLFKKTKQNKNVTYQILFTLEKANDNFS